MFKNLICDRRIRARVKRKAYKMVARPALMYDLETVALTGKKRQEAELKMLRF